MAETSLLPRSTNVLQQTHAEEDFDMVDADLLADFDLDSGSEKDFFMEQLRVAPPEEVDMLLSSLKRTVKPSLTKAPTPTDKTDEATQSLLKLEVADFAQKRAAALPEGVPTKEQLNDFKEEVYMYGIGLNLGETQALLAAAKAEADVVKARGLKTMKSQLAQPQPPIEAINKTIEHFTKIQDAVGQLFKDLPQSQGVKKLEDEKKSEGDSTAAAKATANKKKRARKSKGGVEMDSPIPTAASSTLASETNKPPKRQKTSPGVGPSAAAVTVAEEVATASDAPKLTRKQKQELYRQELEKKRPVIAKVLPGGTNAAPNSEKVTTATAILPSAAPLPASTEPQQASPVAVKEPAQKTRQRSRKSAGQKQLEKTANPIVAAPAPATSANSGAPTTSEAVSDVPFVDMRAPKKKKRGRKSTGPVKEAADKDTALQPASAAAILPGKETSGAAKFIAPESALVPVVAAAQSEAQEADKDNKSKSKSRRQSKVDKRKSLGNDSAAAVSSVVVVPATSVATSENAAAVKQTPIPPPGRAILPPQAPASAPRPLSAEAVVAKTTPLSIATPAATILAPSTTPILPPSSVSKLILKQSPAVAATSAPILPGATPKAGTPLAGISAPNSSGKARKRGSRKSDVSSKTADEPKENHS